MKLGLFRGHGKSLTLLKSLLGYKIEPVLINLETGEINEQKKKVLKHE